MAVMTSFSIQLAKGFIRANSLSINPSRYLSGISELPKVSSYVIHPKSKKFRDNEIFHITASNPTSQIPPGFVEFSEQLDVGPWKRLIEKALVFENHFETSSFDTVQLGETKNLSIVQNLLKVIFSQSLNFTALRDLHLSGESHISSSWHYKERQLDVRGRPGLLVKSKKPLQAFFKMAEFDNEFSEDFNTTDNAFAKFKPRNVLEGGQQTTSSVSHFPYYHTVIRYHDLEALDDSIIHNTILFLYGIARRQCIARNKAMESANTEFIPECVQGLVTNGKEFVFIWYQLNNSSLVNRSDVCGSNVVAFSESEKLFESIALTTRRQDYSSRRLMNYDEHILRKLVALFLW